jgi:exonuclease SbcC
LELSGADLLSSEGETKGKEKSGSKALDLVAYDSATRADELPVDFLSGSQRFRVAVSLALGIGQYASHGSRRIESVIIDEGFGSLDKQGCGEMIAELQRLKDVLGRIILVSHQEEVADAFPNNKYLVELVDGTSRVSLMAE